MSREQLFAAFFFAVFLFLLWQLYLFLAPFLAPLVWAGIIALTFSPLARWLTQALGGRRALAATLLVVGVTVVVILPAFLIGSTLVRQATGVYLRVQEAVRQGELTVLVDQLRQSPAGGLFTRAAHVLDQLSIDLTQLLLRATNVVSEFVVGQAGALARNVLASVFSFTMMLVALFFFFRDGEVMSARFLELLPMEEAHKEAIFARFTATLSAVMQSMVVTAVAQGVLAGVGFRLIGGLEFSLFLGVLSGVASFVPVAGPALVWASAAVYLGLSGFLARAVGLALWGTLVVSTADNWIKPLFISGRADLPTFPLLLAMLGGLTVYGFLGLFLGPVVLAILYVFVDIYREEYHDAGPGRPAPAPPETAADPGSGAAGS